MESYRPLYRWMREAEMLPLVTWFINHWASTFFSMPWDINKLTLHASNCDNFANYWLTGLLMCTKNYNLPLRSHTCRIGCRSLTVFDTIAVEKHGKSWIRPTLPFIWNLWQDFIWGCKSSTLKSVLFTCSKTKAGVRDLEKKKRKFI